MITGRLARLAQRACVAVHSQRFALCGADGGSSALFRVANVTTERREGLFKPLTASGTIVVDGVVASVHSNWFADAAMDRLGLTHALPALYQVRSLTTPVKHAPGAAYANAGRMCNTVRASLRWTLPFSMKGSGYSTKLVGDLPRGFVAT